MKHQVRSSITLVVLLVLSSVASAQSSTRAALVARIDSIASAPVKSGAVAGIAVAVVKGRDTLPHRRDDG